MDCEQNGSITICGNFAELLPEKPKEMDFDRTAKWLEPYSFDWREQVGGTICNCKTIKVHYAPYYGYDYFHSDTCFLVQKYNNTSNAEMFGSMQYLPSITHWEDAVPATASRFYIKGRSSSSKIKVRLSQRRADQLEMQLGGIS
jgi:hypothetical protein